MINKKPRIPSPVQIPEHLSFYKVFATIWLHKQSVRIRAMPIYPT